jgi:hypothetical protein
LGDGMALGAVGRDGAGRAALGPADGKDIIALGEFLAAVADAGHHEIRLQHAGAELDLTRTDGLGHGAEHEMHGHRLFAGLVAGKTLQGLQVLGLA